MEIQAYFGRCVIFSLEMGAEGAEGEVVISSILFFIWNESKKAKGCFILGFGVE